MSRTLCLLLLCCVPALCAGGAARANDVVVATLEWEPYVGSGLPDNGYVGRVVREAFARSGLTVRFLFLPWPRVLDKARHADVDAYGPEYDAPALHERFAVSDPFPGGPLGFFTRADAGISSSRQDLGGYSIAVVRGYVNTPELDSASGPERQEVPSDELGLLMLMNRRVDLLVADRLVGERLLRRLHPGRFGEVVFLEPPLAEKTLHLCFPLERPDHARLLAAFNAGLRALRDDGTLAKLHDALTSSALSPPS